MDVEIIERVISDEKYEELINMKKDNRNLVVQLASVAMRKEDLDDIYKKRALEMLKVLNSDKECIHRSKTVLTPIQVKTVEQFERVPFMLLVFGTGLGKTLMALTASQCFLDENPDSKVIVLSPASLLNNFRKEMKKYGGDNIDKYNFYSFDRVMNLYSEGIEIDGENSLLIIDEAHNLKNYHGKMFDSVMSLAKQSQKRLLLTATPIVNEYKDIISIINLLHGNYVLRPNYVNIDLERMERKGEYIPELKKDLTISAWNLKPGRYIKESDNLDETNKELVDHIESEVGKYLYGNPGEELIAYMNKESNEDFPTYETIFEYIKMTPEYQNVFVKSLKEIFKNPETFYHGYRKAVNGLGDEYVSQKLNKIVEIISENKSHQSVIYTSWLEYGVNVIEKILGDNGITYKTIKGSCTLRRRNIAVNEFNNKKIDVLVITKAGCEGLDLKEVRNIFVLDPPWNPSSLEQIMGRGIRYQSHINLPKEERHVKIYFLVLVESYLDQSIIDQNVYSGLSGDLILYKIIHKKKYIINNFNEFLKSYSIKYTPREKNASSAVIDDLEIYQLDKPPHIWYNVDKKSRFPKVVINNLVFSVATPVNVLKNVYKSDEEYYLGLIYDCGDIQIGVTGTKKSDENFHEALAREVCEESGLLMDPYKYPMGEFKMRRKVWKTPMDIVHVNDTKIGCNYIKDTNILDKVGKDQKKHKVCVLINGSKEDFVSKYSEIMNDEESLSTILKNRSSDNISGYVIIHKDYVKKLVEVMKNNL